LEDVVSVVQYVPPAAFAEQSVIEEALRTAGMGQARRHLIPVTRLLRRDALVELEVIAVRPDERAAQGDAIRLMSGAHSLTVFGEAHGESEEGSLEAVLEKEVVAAHASLEQAGCDWRQVARCRLLVADD